MTDAVLLVSAGWLISTVWYEFTRERMYYPVDFLSLTNAIAMLAFALPPVGYVLWTEYAASVNALFNGTFAPSGVSITATIIALGAHIAVIAVHEVLRRRQKPDRPLNSSYRTLTDSLIERDLTILVLSIAVIGGGAFTLYAMSLGGWPRMWELSFRIRANYIQAEYGFFKIISTLLLPAFYLAFAMFLEARAWRRWAWSAAVVVLAALSFALLYHDGSRLFLVVMILTPIVTVYALRQRGFFLVAPTLLVCAVVFYAFADALYVNLFTTYKVELTAIDLAGYGGKIAGLLSEFSFPYFVLIEYVERVPQEIPYRGITDVVNGIIILMPSVLVGADPHYIFDINRSIFDAPIPIDSLSFGYAAYGLAGTGLVVLLFAVLIGVCDVFFAAARRPFQVIMRTAFLFQVPWLFMYGDPVNAVKRVFATSVAFVMLMALALYVSRKRPAQGTEHTAP